MGLELVAVPLGERTAGCLHAEVPGLVADVADWWQ